MQALDVAEAARAAAVAPLQAEVSRLTQRVLALQQLHTRELAAAEAAVRQQAQAAADQLAVAGSSAQRELRGEQARAEGLAAELTRVREELARHTQRAATTIEGLEQQLGLLRGRIR